MDLFDQTKISHLHLVDIKTEQQRVADDKMEEDRSLYTVFNVLISSRLIFCSISGAYRTKALHWLFPGDPEEKHKDTRKKRHPDTGEWFFETEEFKSWAREPSSWLFCHGKRIFPTLVVFCRQILTEGGG